MVIACYQIPYPRSKLISPRPNRPIYYPIFPDWYGTIRSKCTVGKISIWILTAKNSVVTNAINMQDCVSIFIEIIVCHPHYLHVFPYSIRLGIYYIN